MAKQTLVQSRFHGGISEDEKDGVKHSFFFGRSLDYRTKPSTLKILPRTAKESAAIVVDLVKWFEPYGTDLYSIGNAGKFYKRTSAGSWSLVDTLTGNTGQGIGYFPYDDYIYLPTSTEIDRYGPMGGTPAVGDDYFSNDTVDLDQFLDASGQTYTLATSIAETATHRQTFTPQKDPQKAVEVLVAAKGTGNWTVTVHDAANVAVATKTLTNANVSVGDQKFTFTTPWVPIRGAEYHFHVTSTVADGTVTTATSADLETADFHNYYQILKTDASYHPVMPFLDFVAFGNGPYIAKYDGYGREFGATVYDPHRLELYKGWLARDMVEIAEYMAIVAWRGGTITDFDTGMIYLWDGVSDSPNFTIDVDDGAVCAAAVHKKTLYYITSAATLYSWNGETQELKTFPKMSLQTYVDIFPGSFGVWRGMPMIGFASDSDNTSIEKGAYSYGSLNEKYSPTLNYDFPVSSGTRTGTGLDIGAVGKRGDSFFIAWKDGTTYGVDVVANDAAPFATAIMESMVFDNERPDKEKAAYTIKVTHKALTTGQSVQLSYKRNRDASYTDGTANTTAGTKETVLQVARKKARFYEFQMKISLAATTASPEILSVSLLFDDLEKETRFGKKA